MFRCHQMLENALIELESVLISLQWQFLYLARDELGRSCVPFSFCFSYEREDEGRPKILPTIIRGRNSLRTTCNHCCDCFQKEREANLRQKSEQHPKLAPDRSVAGLCPLCKHQVSCQWAARCSDEGQMSLPDMFCWLQCPLTCT